MHLDNNLWNSSYLFGNYKRIFINTTLGCKASCSYCYLPQIGFEIGKKPTNTIAYKQLISSIKDSKNFIVGKKGTIISLGCFSECWDRSNRSKTKDLIKFFISQGNPVQLSTKRFISWKNLLDVKKLIQWKGQLTIFISCSTITQWQEYEKGTTNPTNRFKSFEIFHALDIPIYLYIKPVIENITILDIAKFFDVMKRYSINSVVGSAFSKDKCSRKKAPIGQGALFYSYTKDEKVIKATLKKCGEVNISSIDPIKKWRGEQ